MFIYGWEGRGTLTSPQCRQCFIVHKKRTGWRSYRPLLLKSWGVTWGPRAADVSHGRLCCTSAHPGPRIRHNGSSADPHLSTAWARHSPPLWLWRGTCVLGCCCCWSGPYKDPSGNLPPWLPYPTQGLFLLSQRLPWFSLLQVTEKMEERGFS